MLAVIEKYLEDGEFSWKSDNPKVGRPHSNKWDEWTCIGLYRAKKEFLEKYPDKRVLDIEGMMEKIYATNIDDLRKNIKRGKNILKSLAKKDGMEWAGVLLAAPNRGKTK